MRSGKDIKLELVRRDIPQKTMAKEIGMLETTLSKIIRGARKPTAKQEKQIEAFFEERE